MNETLISDIKILLQMLRGSPRCESHQQQLEQFYQLQADSYDGFREKLLHGRREMIQQLNMVPELSIVELGGGTGRNLGYLDFPVRACRQVDIVDLCPSLLDVARQRYHEHGNVGIHLADATTFRPQSSVDRVFFSYALTMMPEWRKAIDNAVSMLKPGGLLGVVDFYVSADSIKPGYRHHADVTRRFWTAWFAHDGVHLNPEHLDYLGKVTRPLHITESYGKIPWLPLLKAPFYIYVGQA